MSEFSHTTVLLQEAVDYLLGSEHHAGTAGIYVDGTFGRGGHSRLLLSRLAADGRVIGIDKDPLAIAAGQQLSAEDGRFVIEQGSFAQLTEFLQARDLVGQVDGILLDLGVSSPQLDDPERGFSFSHDGPLDMRMNPEQGQSAAEWLATAGEKEIADVLFTYGEERFSRRMARAIVAARVQAPIDTTKRLADIVAAANPRWEKGKHPATRAFQGIRIFINQELDDLEQGLAQALEMLKVGGRLVVISFHSLEDRMVKRFIRRQVKGDEVPIDIPLQQSQLNQRMKAIGKAIKAGQDEVKNNVRSRSAVMRVAEKIA